MFKVNSRMGSRKNKRMVIEDLEITDIALEGRSVGKSDGRVIFVEGAVPGDIVDADVTRRKAGLYEGRVKKIKKASPYRVEPFCEHFYLCGGCRWQHLSYEGQLKFKQNQVVNQIKRIGEVDIPEILPMLPAPETKYYRNKLNFSFSATRWLTRNEIESGDDFKDTRGLGYFIPRRFDKVLDIQWCYLQPEPSNKIRNTIRKLAHDLDLSFYNNLTKEGYLRDMVIRNNHEDEWMVIISFHYDEKETREKLLDGLLKEVPGITSLMYVINPKLNDVTLDLDIITYHGKDSLVQRLGDLEFTMGPKSFFQTNARQTINLYNIAMEFADLKGHELAYDLYSGTGTITSFMARNCKKAIGIESIEEAVIAARKNAEHNGVENVEFFVGDVRKTLTPDFIKEHGKPDVIMVDPARPGMHPDVIKTIIEAAPERLVYVSCNPGTQARDIKLLSNDFTLVKIQPVDMFPHTHHVENVALLVSCQC